MGTRIVYFMFVIATAATIASAWMSGGPVSTDAPGTTATLRLVDVPRIQRMIQEGRLSDHEARFFRPTPDPDTPR